MSEPDPRTSWSVQRERTVQLVGHLRGLACRSGTGLDPGDRSSILESAVLLARSIGRPDLAPSAPEPASI